MDLKESDILGASASEHWYYRSKAAAVSRLLAGRASRRVLDVGAGSGFFSRHLLANTDISEAWCIDTAYESSSDSCVSGKTVHYRQAVSDIDVDLVLFMDVLEHVDNDVGLLQEYAARVPSGTLFLISVPAFQSLWSGHDEFLEHKRRYTVAQLEGAVRRANLRVHSAVYFFGLVFPIAATIRLTSRLMASSSKPAGSQLRLHHPMVNALLFNLCRAELSIMRMNRVAGLTVFCLASNP